MGWGRRPGVCGVVVARVVTDNCVAIPLKVKDACVSSDHFGAASWEWQPKAVDNKSRVGTIGEGKTAYQGG